MCSSISKMVDLSSMQVDNSNLNISLFIISSSVIHCFFQKQVTLHYLNV